ncbi:hypothetical protein COCOBI_15-1610 [Coccomyxa sp. Obi]|nr:hypothetical protein COCOBI_15-1610 [Coccomyxa sp. Obi]
MALLFSSSESLGDRALLDGQLSDGTLATMYPLRDLSQSGLPPLTKRGLFRLRKRSDSASTTPPAASRVQQ